MPELPEVETTRLGLAAQLPGRRVSTVIVRDARLRQPVPADFATRLTGQTLAGIERRGKYLLLRFEQGTVLAHLGMSGSLRVLPADTPAQKHDHVDVVFGERAMRLRDPRRFGLLLWIEGDPAAHPLLAGLGIEPLEAGFDGDWLFAATRGRNTPIKLLIMDNHTLVGVGNIYASESLFRAGIRPRTAARRLTRAQCERLAAAIRATLNDALAAGGSSLRDYRGSDGEPGWFQTEILVYGRTDEPCRVCGTPIRQLVMGQRSTFWCPHCQR